MSYKAKTTFKYQYDEKEYSAMMYKGKIQETTGDFRTFNTIDEWIAVLPNCTKDAIVINEPIQKIAEGYNVPKRRNASLCSAYAILIYELIEEAAPHILKRDDIRIAYNTIIEHIKDMDTLIMILPNKRNKYMAFYEGHCPVNKNKYHSFKRKIGNWVDLWMIRETNPEEYKRREEQKEKLGELYKVLYDLVSEHIVPYCIKKHKEIHNAGKIKRCYRAITKVEYKIRDLEVKIEEYRKHIAELM